MPRSVVSSLSLAAGSLIPRQRSWRASSFLRLASWLPTRLPDVRCTMPRVCDDVEGFGSSRIPPKIPSAFDRQLAEIGDIASGITVRLTVMRFAGKGARDFAGLRGQLQ